VSLYPGPSGIAAPATEACKATSEVAGYSTKGDHNFSSNKKYDSDIATYRKYRHEDWQCKNIGDGHREDGAHTNQVADEGVRVGHGINTTTCRHEGCLENIITQGLYQNHFIGEANKMVKEAQKKEAGAVEDKEAANKMVKETQKKEAAAVEDKEAVIREVLCKVCLALKLDCMFAMVSCCHMICVNCLN